MQGPSRKRRLTIALKKTQFHVSCQGHPLADRSADMHMLLWVGGYSYLISSSYMVLFDPPGKPAGINVLSWVAAKVAARNAIYVSRRHRDQSMQHIPEMLHTLVGLYVSRVQQLCVDASTRGQLGGVADSFLVLLKYHRAEAQ